MSENNPFLKRIAARNIGDSGRSSEKRLAKAMGGRLQPASGAMSHAKGDFKLKRALNFTAEAKSSTGDSLRIDLNWLLKITEESLQQGTKPMLTISFVTPDGKPRGLREDWVCIPKSAFDELTEEK